MFKRFSFILLALLSIGVGIYPVIYFIVSDRRFGLLQSKTDELLADRFWNTGFYVHIICSGTALLIGWMQFIRRWRDHNLSLHRFMGKVYVVAVAAGALAGIYIGFYATGGIVAATGFIMLGLIWLGTTIAAYVFIINGNIQKHRAMMTYSYAACFAAVTLRIWLPLLINLTGDFYTAYRIVAWLCWVPNLLFAKFVLLSPRILRADPVLSRQIDN